MSTESKAKKLIVIPNDPVYRYAAKGEIKERYFNPENLFDEIHVLSLSPADDALDAVKVMAGRAEVRIHALGRPGPLSWRLVMRRAVELARELKPQAVRGYNPLFMGWLAVKIARAVGAVSVISVHADYSFLRSLRIYGAGYPFSVRGAYHLLHGLLGLNRTSLGLADHVICAYRFPLHYVKHWRRERVSVIYNRVDLTRFQPARRDNDRLDRPLRILNVGRQFEGKNPEPIIRALAGLDSARLTLIGDGPYHQRMVRLSASLGLEDRVTFITRAAHQDLPQVYREHDIFAMAITHPGVCIPVLEAAASGLPVVINQPLWEDEPEVVGNLAEVVPLSSDGFCKAFRHLSRDPNYCFQRGVALRAKALEYDGVAMERAERELYEKLINQAGGPKSAR